MQLNDAQIKALLERLDEKFVGTRESDEQLIVFHDYVRARLSEIFGPLGWSEQHLEVTEVPAGDGGRLKFLAYRARVRVTIHPHGTPVAYWDGAGAWGQGRDLRESGPTSIWDLHSDCMNGALSVAFLRATKNLGHAFGLFLYARNRHQPTYEITRFLNQPDPSEYGAKSDTDQQEFDMDYTPDPDEEDQHAAS
jgi:hypothetical protein